MQSTQPALETNPAPADQEAPVSGHRSILARAALDCGLSSDDVRAYLQGGLTQREVAL
jgi:hypothetical protein